MSPPRLNSTLATLDIGQLLTVVYIALLILTLVTSLVTSATFCPELDISVTLSHALLCPHAIVHNVPSAWNGLATRLVHLTNPTHFLQDVHTCPTPPPQ